MKQEGAKVTSVIGPNANDRTDIAKGVINGDDLTLEAVVADQDLR